MPTPKTGEYDGDTTELKRSYRIPAKVQANAQKALDVRKDKPASQQGMTDTGLATARKLSGGGSISYEMVKKISEYFPRHEVDKKGKTWSEKGKGWQAWNGWGGDAGWSWSKKIVKKAEKMELERIHAIKDIVHAGEWTGGNGNTIKIDRAWLQDKVDKFYQMKKNGLHVALMDAHEGGNPLGSIEDMAVIGDMIIADTSFPDEDAKRQAERARFVSIGTENEYRDGAGREYGEVIQHVAATEDPAVPGQADYQFLSRVGHPAQTDNAAPPDVERPHNEEEDGMYKEWLPDLLGVEDEDAAKEKLTALLSNDPTKDKKNEEAEAELALARDDANELRASALEDKLGQMVELGRITSDGADKLKAVLAGEQGKRNAVMLARGDAAKAPAFALLDVINELRAGVPAGEETGAQTTLARPTDDQDDAELKRKTDDRTDRMAEYANGPNAE